MNKDDEYMYLEFMKDIEFATLIILKCCVRTRIKSTDCKSKAFESNCEIRTDVLDNYISNRSRTRNQSYVNLLQFFQKNFTKIKYRMTKDHVNSNRSLFMKALEDFHVCLYL